MVTVTVNVTSAPTPMPVTIINSAIINGFGAVAPGELIAIKGTNLGPVCAGAACVSGGAQFTVNAQGTVSSTLAGVQVLFDTIPGTPTYVSPTQINVIVPWEIAGRVATNMVVSYNGVASAAFPLQVAAVSPGIYTQNATGSGQSAALNLSAQAAALQRSGRGNVRRDQHSDGAGAARLGGGSLSDGRRADQSGRHRWHNQLRDGVDAAQELDAGIECSDGNGGQLARHGAFRRRSADADYGRGPDQFAVTRAG